MTAVARDAPTRRPRKPKRYNPAAHYLPMRLSASVFRQWTARHLHKEAMKFPRGKKRKAALKRAYRLRGCGANMRTFRCKGCKHLAPGVGELDLLPCRSRVCPSCERIRSRREAARLIALMERIRSKHKLPKEDRPKFWTFTSAFDPTDPKQVTADALAERVDLLLRVIAKLWARVFKPRGAIAMFVRVELGLSGAVHAHAILIGPYVPNEVIEAYGKKIWPDFGHPWSVAARVDAESGLAREVAKYSVKCAGSLSEGWLAGEARVCMDPELAAAWEFGTMRKHLQRSYGEFRGAIEKETEDKCPEEENEREAHVAKLQCPACGVTGQWSPIMIDTEDGIRALHERRLPALWKSRWSPSADDW